MALDDAQLVTLGNHIRANPDVATFLANGVLGEITDYYNGVASPVFWAWKAMVSQADTGQALRLDDVGGLTTANSTRLQVAFQLRPNGFDPGDQSDRALFGDVFSAAGAVNTRAAVIAAWQRQVTYAEKLFATGTGTQASGLEPDGAITTGSPGTLVFAGTVTTAEVDRALELTA